jgi:hypothetical protein
MPKDLAHFMSETGFKPNEAQLEAILHDGGPLYLPALAGDAFGKQNTASRGKG